MTAAGAEGETLDEMRRVLALPGDATKAPAAEWTARLNSTRGVDMTVANRVWGRKGLSFRQEFVKLTASRYGAGLEALDFPADAEGSRHHINRWVSEKTGGRISDLLGPGVLGADTQLVLTNAVYFHGRWMTPFEPRATSRREFTPASGQKVQVQTMRKTFSADYLEDEGLQALRLPYEGGELAMIVLLPRKVDAVAEGFLPDAAAFTLIRSGLRREPEVVVQLPKFEATTQLTLADLLQRLGLTRAFQPTAQFGRLCEQSVRISAVIHKAWVKVQETGTEAAAATATIQPVPGPAGARPVKPPPKLFIADHPFLFFIVDDRTGGILFAGRVIHPAAAPTARP